MKVLLLISMSLFASLSVFAQSASKLSVCYEEWQPFAYKGADGVIQGQVISELNKQAKALAIALEYQELPYARCVQLVKAGVLDIALFADPTDGLTLLPQVISHWDIAVASPSSKAIKTLEEFRSDAIKKVLIARDYVYPDAVNEKLASYDKKLVKASYYTTNDKDIRRVFSYILDGKVDAMIVDKHWADIAKEKLKINMVVSDWLIHREPQYAGYGKLSLEKLTHVKALLTAFK